MSKFMKKAFALMLCLAMALSVMVLPAFAETHGDEGTGTMNPKVPVYAIGTKSFVKIEQKTTATGTVFEVSFGDQDADGFEAIPAQYIKNSEFNIGNIDYGFYLDSTGEPHYVKLSDCLGDAANGYLFDHGTKDSAVVSDEVDTADNADPEMGTQFYINIENGYDPDGREVDTKVISGTEDERINYEITVAQKSNFQLKATVPMYVCMYGYRGTGNVVAPSKEAYQIKNYSTIDGSDEAEIIDITKLTTYAKILDEDHSDQQLFAIAFDETEGKYQWWYSDPSSTEGWVAPDNYKQISDLKINASGEMFVIFLNDEYSFKAAGVLADGVLRETVTKCDPALAADFELNGFNFGKEPAVGQTKEGDGSLTKGLAIEISELQAIPATWKLVGMDKDIKAGEIFMSLAPAQARYDASAIDLSTVSAKSDISARGWDLAAPATVENDGTVKDENATILPMIVKARIAGGNVNPAGCAPVVKVNYTISPLFADGDAQTNSDRVVTSNVG